MTKQIRILHGDCVEVLGTIEADSIDAGVTDPPYGIGFMGREWDTFKPGAHRQAARLAKGEAIVSENPNINGRRRSPAISESQIDYDYSVAGLRRFQEWTAEWAAAVYRVLKPGAYIVVCGAPRSYHRMACGLEDAGFVVRDKFAWLFGSGFPKSRNLGDGKGTALKPGHEPIVLAWKPFKGTIATCHHDHGTAALYIDACRLTVADSTRTRATALGIGGTTDARERRSEFAMTAGSASEIGRWPPNVLLDEAAAALLDEQSGDLVSGANPTRRDGDKFRDVYGEFAGQAVCEPARGVDVGGASRFYYVAKPSREERDLGTEHLPPRQRDYSRDQAAPGANNPRNSGGQLRGNFHPTVKPIALMRWLIRLVTPPGGTVLDPFLGSGTTGMAARLEQRAFIGIEREDDYLELAQHRIRAVAPLFLEV